jgi:alcohol dehydrogenase class IV
MVTPPRGLPPYDFLAPRIIVFGWGRREEVGRLAVCLGRRAFLVCGSRTLQTNGVLDDLIRLLYASAVETSFLGAIAHEPEVADVDRMAADLRKRGGGPGDLVLAVGGGSAIDLAKAVAALATNTGGTTVSDYLEGVGRGLVLTAPPLPVLALPTTAGTGTEATKNAVISSYDPPFKKSLRSEKIMPSAVLIDPELTVSVPPATTAATGMDAITQLLESYLSRRAKPIPQALSLQGLGLALKALPRAVEDGRCREAREHMAHAALLSGLALANSGLGFAHGVAAALGVVCRVPHGLACAVMLPTALRVNRSACGLEMTRLAAALLGQDFSSQDAAADAVIDLVERLCLRLGIPRRLSALGVLPGQLAELVRCSRGTSMSGNRQEVSDEELTRLLAEML